MKQIEDIFETKAEKPKKNNIQNPKVPIIIDTREKNSLIASNLIEKNANIKFEFLEIADYLIGETAIERKTFSDFISSMINKRLMEQLTEIKKYSSYFLIIEGFNYNYPENMENAIKGMILSVIVNYKIPIIFTKNEEDTANFLILLAKKQEKPKSEFSLRPSKSFKTLEEQKQFILEGFPGIGPSNAKKLLKEFHSIKNIINMDKEKLKLILGKKSEDFIRLIED
ncbi:MAG: ERCC4 domain-containing protein [Nanoarchaeota archaeon]|nr:ERCC4 domain-containing protein [Nanoarchaeota archaeon]